MLVGNYINLIYVESTTSNVVENLVARKLKVIFQYVAKFKIHTAKKKDEPSITQAVLKLG